LNRIKPAVLSALFLFLSCGIGEYYYLPQVPESNINSSLTEIAVINLLDIDKPEYYYATNYSIFYRIYISKEIISSIENSTDRNTVNPALARDFNSLSSYTDPSNSSFVTDANFKNLKYFEIELEGEKVADIFTKNGGTLRINFPTSSGSHPTVSKDGGKQNVRLHRSSNFYLPSSERLFINTAALTDNTNINNADVEALTDGLYAYVSMYIVARGYNNELFTPIYGKPTHINIFRLPEN